MILPCHSVNNENIDHRLSFAACSLSLAGCSTPKSSKGHSKSLRASAIQETVLSVCELADSKDACVNDSVVIKDNQTVQDRVVCCDNAADNLQSQRLQSEDESQAFNIRRHRQKRKNVTSFDCRSYVESSLLSERDGVKSTSGIDTEVHHEPDIEPPLESDLSQSLSPSYSICDAVDVSQIEQHVVPQATAGCAESEGDTTNVQDVEHEHQVDLLTEDSICSEMSDEDSVNAAEQTELSSTSVTVTANAHTPASPSLYSADEEDGVCSQSSQGDEESADENEEVNSFLV